MGAGRKTETITGGYLSAFADGGMVPHRNLPSHQLGSVIFGCQPETQNECISDNLFGLPLGHLKYVRNITEGMPLFLFNFTDRLMYGVFEATGPGDANINPHGWTGGKGKTPFPAQVPIKIRKLYDPLHEDVFRKVVFDNYYLEGKFHFELDKYQTENLIKLFVSGPPKGFTVTLDSKPRTCPSKVTSKNGGNAADGCKGADVDGWILPKKTARKAAATAKTEHDVKGTTRVSEEMSLSGFRNLKVEATESEEWTEKEDGMAALSETTNGNFEECCSLKGTEAFGYTSSQRVEECGSWKDWEDQLENFEEPVSSQRQMEPLKAASIPGKNSNTDTHFSVGIPWTSLSQPDFHSTWSSEEKQESSSGLDVGASKLPIYSHSNRRDVAEAKHELFDDHTAVIPQVKDKPSYLEIVSNNAKRKDCPANAFEGSTAILAGKVGQYQTSSSSSEWDRLAGEDFVNKGGVSEEPGDILFTFEDLKTVIAAEVQKSYGSYASAMAELCTYQEELKRTINEEMHKLQQRNNSLENTFSAQLDALRTEVSELKTQLNETWAKKSLDCSEVYLMGGYDGKFLLRDVQVYSCTTNKLRPAAPLLSPRSCAAATVLNGRVFVFGGMGEGSWVDSVHMYEKAQDDWITCAPMQIKRGSLAGVTIGDCIYAVGGRGNGIGAAFSEVEFYNPCSGSWMSTTSMLEKRCLLGAAAFGGSIYAVGGNDGMNYLATSERFDPREGIWKRLPSMLTKRGCLSTAFCKGILYALGGYNGERYLSTAECFDPRACRWETVNSMNSNRALGAAVALGESLYIMGGGPNSTEFYDFFECYNDATGWRIIRPHTFCGRALLAVATISGHVYQ